MALLAPVIRYSAKVLLLRQDLPDEDIIEMGLQGINQCPEIERGTGGRAILAHTIIKLIKLVRSSSGQVVGFFPVEKTMVGRFIGNISRFRKLPRTNRELDLSYPEGEPEVIMNIKFEIEWCTFACVTTLRREGVKWDPAPLDLRKIIRDRELDDGSTSIRTPSEGGSEMGDAPPK